MCSRSAVSLIPGLQAPGIIYLMEGMNVVWRIYSMIMEHKSKALLLQTSMGVQYAVLCFCRQNSQELPWCYLTELLWLWKGAMLGRSMWSSMLGGGYWFSQHRYNHHSTESSLRHSMECWCMLYCVFSFFSLPGFLHSCTTHPESFTVFIFQNYGI